MTLRSGDIRTADAIAEAEESGKPAEIAEKIATGKVRRYLEDNALMHQKYVLDEAKQVREILGRHEHHEVRPLHVRRVTV